MMDSGLPTPGYPARGGAVLAKSRGCPASGLLHEERGSVSAMLVVAFPILLLVVSLVLDAGAAVWARAIAQASADMAALAGVQEIDLEMLALGERRLLEDAAASRARSVGLENLEALAGGLGPALEHSMEILVLNPEGGGTIIHPRDGRRLKDPTVCVVVQLKVTVPSPAFSRRRVEVSAHADASVVEKK